MSEIKERKYPRSFGLARKEESREFWDMGSA